LSCKKKIEADGRPKVEIVTEALEHYFASKMKQNDSNNITSANNSVSQNDSNISHGDSNINQSNSNISKIEQTDNNEVLE